MRRFDYLLHGFLHLRLELGRVPWSRYLLDRYAAYLCPPEKVPSGPPDLRLCVGREFPEQPDPHRGYRVDDRIRVWRGGEPGSLWAGGGLECRQAYKGARWQVRIGGLEAGPITAWLGLNALAAPVVAGNTVPTLLRLALDRKRAVLLHGSAAEKDGKALVLCGRSGAGKTLASARLAAKGWRHLGDDSCLVREGRIFGFLQPMTLRFTYDVRSLLGVEFSSKERCAIAAKSFLARATAGRIGLLTSVDPRRVFGSSLSDAADAGDFVLMRGSQGEIRGRVEAVERERILQDALANLRFECRELDSYLEAFCYAFPDSPLVGFWRRQAETLAQALKASRCHAWTAPARLSDTAIEGLLSALASSSVAESG